MHPSTEDDTPWERVLWKSQRFEDNYVPESFNPALKRNARVRIHTYSDLVLDACSITQTLAVVFIFVSTFCRLLTHSLDPRLLLWTCLMGFVGGVAVWEWSDGKAIDEVGMTYVNVVRSSILVFLALTAVTPVLKTLTEASSSDSIWALAAMLFILHMLLADYKVSPGSPYRLSAILSMNAAISAGVVLASRLETNQGVFALTLLAFKLFGLYPLIRTRIMRQRPSIRFTITLAISGYASALMWSVSRLVSQWTMFTLCFITFACPGLFVWAQRFKNEIHGPWDPATPLVRIVVE